jgi:NADPH:quinone reductase-like Zn-dependent oxidoreductase
MAQPVTTKAVRIFEHGNEDVLRYDDYPLEEAGPTDVVVRVAAASVSRFDLKYRIGLPPSAQLPGRRLFPLPQQLGREAAGEVVAVGSEVTRCAVGDRVVAVVHPEAVHSAEVARGLGNLSTGVDLPGHQSLGGYAEYLVRDETMWFPLQPHVDLEQAAVTIWAFATSHRILRDRLDLAIGDAILVLGASGGMGAATVQLAAMQGAEVIAVTRSHAKVAALQNIGARHVVVTEDLAKAAEQIESITAGAGVRHVVDYVGDGDLLRWSIGRIGLGGKLVVSTGEMGTGPLPLTAMDFLRTELTVLGIRGARRHDALVALDLLTNQRIHTPIAARFPLTQAADAHRYLETNSGEIGRVVLLP